MYLVNIMQEIKENRQVTHWYRHDVYPPLPSVSGPSVIITSTAEAAADGELELAKQNFVFKGSKFSLHVVTKNI